MVQPKLRNDNPGLAMDLKIQIGIKVKAARQEKGLTQEQLAEAIGKAVETVSNIERGFALTGIGTLQQISKITGKRMAYFFEDAEDARQTSPARMEAEERLRTLIRRLHDGELPLATSLLLSVIEHHRN